MKILVSCPECTLSQQKNNAAVLEINNDSTYAVICENGHIQSIYIPQQRHEILFEIGAYAVIDGYCREAISSFSASLERYCEFFIQVICIASDSNGFEKAWKLVSSQSERQLGGYVFSHLFTYGSPPVLLENKFVSLRNNVIHKGYIPTRKEAVSFGQSVADLINVGCQRIKLTHDQEINEIIRRVMYPNGLNSNNRIHIPATYLNVMSGKSRITLEEHLSGIATHNKPRFES